MFRKKRIFKTLLCHSTGLVSDPKQAELIKISVKMSRLMVDPKNKFHKIVKEVVRDWFPYVPFHVLFYEG